MTVEGNGEIHQVVIIAEDLEMMYWEVHRLYGYLLKDKDGKDIGKISFEETILT
ncbi:MULTISPECIES: hypothetical protein [unclassified Bacillus (in: firmicutes)]|uniref:hypothetical protein n=1 Tax=unclassified Bacillus (in: firmicutes) TaxID=185979 RepID=UPI001BE8FE38|nr:MULTISPECIES: hypothetical protein [unclassified Bacillus (in: firmicutes)]MBT2613854.1 hypothetical protein [Bacillus sp. ISL-78]MBT2627732.1 hypothetical protein [Bacillus sp. ISL-101]MBT2718099.1 hypothetical protein [Bacillus sp. ISL-57]